MPSIAAYLRVSGDEQRLQNTIEAQRHFAAEYAALMHPDALLRWYIDDGVTGMIPLQDRPAGAQLLAAAAAGEISIVLVYKLDRLARKSLYILDAIDRLSKHGVSLCSMTQQFDTSTAMGRAFLQIMASFAELDREQLLERTIAGKARVARAGRIAGGVPPYGYAVGEDKALILDDTIVAPGFTAADVIRHIYAWYLEGANTYQIAARLTAYRIPTATERGLFKARHSYIPGVWKWTSVYKILTNDSYTGEHVYTTRDGETMTQPFPALVSLADFDAVQAKLALSRGKRSEARDYLLRGLIACGHCGRPMSGVTFPTTPGRHYYRCNSSTHRGETEKPCEYPVLHAGYVEDQIWEDCQAFLQGRIADIDLTPTEPREDASAVIVGEKAAIEDAVARIAGEREKIIRAYRKGMIEEDEAQEQLREVEGEQRALRKRLADVTAMLSVVPSPVVQNDIHQALAARLVAAGDAVSDEIRAEVVSILVNRIQATPRGKVIVPGTRGRAGTGARNRAHFTVQVEYVFGVREFAYVNGE